MRGHPAEGRRRLETLASAAAMGHYEHCPQPAWLRAKAGLCALAAGDSAGARQLLLQARKAFQAQPEVSDYFKQPLLKLERALRQ